MTSAELAALANPDLEQRSVNAIRVLAMDAVQKADSGHPGAPMGLADAAYVLWSKILRFDPQAPDWPNRDRFVLSAGHACMLQYALLHLLGYDLPMEQIQDFRQWGSATPGHPEFGHTVGIETTTGPLGQGLATAVGMALAEKHLGARLNTAAHRIVDHHTYVFASDGDIMEGVQSEAASLAGHLGLGKLVVLYDDNRITIDGSIDLAFSEDVDARYRAYGWHVVHVDGHDRTALERAFAEARDRTEQPSLIVARTHIGLGAPHRQDTAKAHGAPLGEEEIALSKENYGWPASPPFHVPDEVREHYRTLGSAHREARLAWERELEGWTGKNPGLAELRRTLTGDPVMPSEGRPVFEPGSKLATRAASGKALDWLLPRVPALLGGSADLTGSNNTKAGDMDLLTREQPGGRYIHFGIREHAMAAACNGLALYGLRPYGGTFLIFSDYLRPSLRLSALMNLPVTYVFTHDSIFLGEDGPTHQPIAALPALRAIPNLTVIRPSDPQETVTAWEVALSRSGPTAMALTRQGLPVLEGGVERAEQLRRGAYVLFDPPGEPAVIAFATGSEVAPALEAARRVTDEGRSVRLVAVPSWELFAEQDAGYRSRILAADIRARIAVEAASPFGWERFVGAEGEIVGMDRFGASAPASVLAEKFGFTADAIADAFRRVGKG